ncbi:MAG: glutamate--tRNA ligase [bacterium]|nr:glutamate--tRNA ligase [bacterium]
MLNFLRNIFSRTTAVRVRIAPSPTGYLHIGTARTALFNWLFAKKYGGTFVLRIEDTDIERSDKKFEKDIIESLKWLGITWDEGPVRQSERLDIYEKYLKKLLKEKKAYWCPHTKEELEKEREWRIANKTVLIHYCDARDKDSEKGELIRFKIPKTKPIVSGNETTYSADSIIFDDIIRSQVHFFTGPLGDFALAKNLRTPLYNFAVVIDDYEMKISHVIRGEDHIANTPKQILIQRALGFSSPQYAHLPLILDPDRSKMSKRFSATSVQEYRNQGYLPEALFNFMALLGWHPTTDIEKLSPKEIIEQFTIERIQKGGAVFDIQKLNWFNGEYIKELNDKELLQRIKNSGVAVSNDESALKILKIGKNRLNTLKDFEELENSFLVSPYDAALLHWKDTPHAHTVKNLKKVATLLDTPKSIMDFATEEGKGAVLWPLRVALSGKDKSPGPFEIMDVIGAKETLRRINAALQKLQDK